ncbi:MAG: class I SAM-dependent methyltransferase [Chloroflexi bacterium]|nr:class I SAM-dependent methyltransferase [Chloroflexota bacterium]
MTEQHRLYGDLAYLWPYFSPPEGYADDSDHWRQAIRQRLGPGCHRILELGSGGGHTLSHLTTDFELTAVDLSWEMLSLSRQLNPGVPHHQGDMRTVRLGEAFDVVAIHDAVCYLTSKADLLATFATARVHLRPGGILLLSPDHLGESFTSPTVLHWICDQQQPRFTVIEYCYDPDPNDTTIESVFFFLLQEKNGLRIEQDLHVTGLFPSVTWLAALDESGFDAELLSLPGYEGGYGGHLFVGRLRE